MLNGEIPFKDFGLPMGYGFWLIPTAFFYIAGPAVHTLLKAQVLINIISLAFFWRILNQFSLNRAVISLSILVMALSFTLPNFWPWYNHSTIVYQWIAFSFAIAYMLQGKYRTMQLVAAGFFTFFSFWTKQDGGGLTFLVILSLLAYHSITAREYKGLLIYVSSFVILAVLFIYPVYDYDFNYWFNYSQPPHYARLSTFDLVDTLLGDSAWIKFYMLLTLIIGYIQFKKDQWKAFHLDHLFFLFTLGVLVEALIFQITSYIPRESNIFFHAFAFAFILQFFSRYVEFKKPLIFGAAVLMVGLWWLNDPWNKFLRHRVDWSDTDQSGHVINRHTFIVTADTTSNDRSGWIEPNLESFRNVRIPPKTIEGINNIRDFLEKNNLSQPYVLNMSELTPLNHEFNFKTDRGQSYPLWFHKGVVLFDREIALYKNKVKNKDYDLILFEVIPQLNEFYPSEVRDVIKEHYKLIDTFMAPRIPDNATIEVYSKK